VQSTLTLGENGNDSFFDADGDVPTDGFTYAT
jgi:hypothetical protein